MWSLGDGRNLISVLNYGLWFETDDIFETRHSEFSYMRCALILHARVLRSSLAVPSENKNKNRTP